MPISEVGIRYIMLAVTTLYSVILLIASRVSRRASRITKVKTCNASSTCPPSSNRRVLYVPTYITFHTNNKEIKHHTIIQAPTVLTENANQSPLSFPNVKIMPMVLWLISQSPAPFSGDGMYMRSMTVSTVGRSSPTARSRWYHMISNVSSLLLLFIYAARRYRKCREKTAGEARASDGRNLFFHAFTLSDYTFCLHLLSRPYTCVYTSQVGVDHLRLFFNF